MGNFQWLKSGLPHSTKLQGGGEKMNGNVATLVNTAVCASCFPVNIACMS